MAALGGDGIRWSADWERQITSQPGFTMAMDLAGAIVEQGMKRRCPVSKDGSHGRPSGYLRSSTNRWHEQDRSVCVGPNAETPEGVQYAKFVEFPTRPHIIRSHGDYPLRNRKRGQVFGREVHHPGTQAQPFIRPALDDLAGRRLG